MAKKIMSLATINTILNTAPLVIQGTARLIKVIRDQDNVSEKQQNRPNTIEGLRNEIDRVQQRLDINNRSNMEQIKLIETLAKQNESLTIQLKKAVTQINQMTVIAIVAIFISLVCLLFLIVK